jgi:hypothetical protein
MTPHARGFLLTLALASVAPAALAEPPDLNTEAETLFQAAKALRTAGKYREACDAFAQSKRLDPGVGVSLNLADCYEHIGKSASAWVEFRDAETRAKERNDTRAAVAQKRAAALEARLSRVEIRIAPVPAAGTEVKVDGGAPLSLADLSGVPVDPGDHEITLRSAGRAARIASAHVEPGATVTVTFEAGSPSPDRPAPAPPAPSVPAPIAVATASAAPATPPQLAPRTLLECYLVGLGVVGVGTGAGLLVVKNDSMSNGTADGAPTYDQRAATASSIAFGIGGAALVTAVIVYLTAPASKDTALVVAPAPLTGGAGAFLRGQF